MIYWIKYGIRGRGRNHYINFVWASYLSYKDQNIEGQNCWLAADQFQWRSRILGLTVRVRQTELIYFNNEANQGGLKRKNKFSHSINIYTYTNNEKKAVTVKVSFLWGKGVLNNSNMYVIIIMTFFFRFTQTTLPVSPAMTCWEMNKQTKKKQQ